jgi:hypothetical protein
MAEGMASPQGFSSTSSTPRHTPHQHCPGGATIPPCPRPPSATYQRLRETIANQMRMSHVYQPLMLMELLGRRSPAPAQDVARRILGEDVTQIEVYPNASSAWWARCSRATASPAASAAPTPWLAA